MMIQEVAVLTSSARNSAMEECYEMGAGKVNRRRPAIDSGVVTSRS